ncbi:putative signal peptide protein [Puccinia sorghi]|uniref:Putative signal peptide protein n=1 Tax=Puccinia sorghi TaxID=27349 RepID=A0A0L6UL15_9BASI|nr:putative signal peptide protein [Puccinia sorghi]
MNDMFFWSWMIWRRTCLPLCLKMADTAMMFHGRRKEKKSSSSFSITHKSFWSQKERRGILLLQIIKRFWSSLAHNQYKVYFSPGEEDGQYFSKSLMTNDYLEEMELGRDGIQTTCFDFIIKPGGLKLKHGIWKHFGKYDFNFRPTFLFKNILFAENCITLGEMKIKEGLGNNQIFMFCSNNNNSNSRNIQSLVLKTVWLMISFDNFQHFTVLIHTELMIQNKTIFFWLNPGDSPSKYHSISSYHLEYSPIQKYHPIFIKLHIVCNSHQIIFIKNQRSMDIMQGNVLLITLFLKLSNLSTPPFLYSLNLYRDTKWINFLSMIVGITSSPLEKCIHWLL